MPHRFWQKEPWFFEECKLYKNIAKPVYLKEIQKHFRSNFLFSTRLSIKYCFIKIVSIVPLQHLESWPISFRSLSTALALLEPTKPRMPNPLLSRHPNYRQIKLLLRDPAIKGSLLIKHKGRDGRGYLRCKGACVICTCRAYIDISLKGSGHLLYVYVQH